VGSARGLVPGLLLGSMIGGGWDDRSTAGWDGGGGDF
jgi:hypothetical protein